MNLIHQKMAQLCIRNFRAYARKMLIDGYIIKVNYTEQKKLAAAVSHAAVNININQIYRRINQTGRYCAADIAELKARQAEIWSLLKEAQKQELWPQEDYNMPRMSKSKKMKWSFSLNDRGRVTFNTLCRKCVHDCKQSFRVVVIECPRYHSKHAKAGRDASLPRGPMDSRHRNNIPPHQRGSDEESISNATPRCRRSFPCRASC